MTTRSARPSSVRATTTLPSRITSRWPYGAQRRLDRVGDLRLVAADRLDVDQRAQQRDEVAVQVQRRGHARHPTAARLPRQLGPSVAPSPAGRLAAMTDSPPSTASRSAWGWGLATVHEPAGVLDTYYPGPALGSPTDEAAPAELVAAQRPRRAARRADRGCVRSRSTWTPPRPTPRRVPAAAPAQPPAGRAAHDQPGRASSAACPTWCGPRRARARSTASSRSAPGCAPGTATVTVYGVDKFPRMVDYVLPSGVRIADADRVRLGAHLAAGTTVMHEGFVNYNAGTLGTSMVEGRISAGVVVGRDSDVGGGASIMGTLSGGGTAGHLGRRALPARRQRRDRHRPRRRLRGRGRPLRHRGHQGHPARRQRGQGARPCPGESGLLFIRNSVTGAIEVRRREGRGVELNADLHAN